MLESKRSDGTCYQVRRLAVWFMNSDLQIDFRERIPDSQESYSAFQQQLFYSFKEVLKLSRRTMSTSQVSQDPNSK